VSELVFEVPLGLQEMIVPLVGTGILLPGFFLFGYMVQRAPNPIYSRTLIVTAIAFIHVAAEALVIIIGGVVHNQAVSSQVARIQQIAVTWLIPAIPFYLAGSLRISRRLRLTNRILVGVGIAVAGLLTVVAFVMPDLFRSVTQPHASALVIESTYGRGARGPLSDLRDIVLFIVILYSNVLIVLEVISYRPSRFSVTVLVGLFTAFTFALVSILDSIVGPLPVSFPWSIAGISIFVLASMLAATWRFVDEARAVETAHSELQTQERRLSYLAYHDQLTGARNRKAFYEVLVGRSQSALSGASPEIALLYIDLDYFKQVNDTYGHRVGDQVLRRATQRLQSAIRHSDALFRIGGDEFAVVVETEDADSELGKIAHKMIAVFDSPIAVEGREFTVGVSIGSSRMPVHASTVEDLVRKADRALYEAKKQRNTFRLYEPEMEGTVHASIDVLDELRTAIRENAIPMLYQPIIVEGSISGVEALLRWKPSGQLEVGVGDIIDLADAAGLMEPLGRSILETVLTDTSPYLKDGTLGYVSVNVTPSQIARHDFGDSLLRIMDSYAVRPDRIRIEVKENQLFDPGRNGLRRAINDSNSEFHVTIDDFGRGYSSLGYLRDFKIQSLKLHAGIAANLLEDRVSETFVRGLTDLARELGLELIVKGVETAVQHERLIDLGCSHFQGFLFGRPGSIGSIIG